MQVQKKIRMVVMALALMGAVGLIPLGASAHTIDQPLKKGVHNQNVKPVQKQLKKMDYYKGQVDGAYGTNTKKAVSQYQKDQGLAMDGIYGTNTSNAMDQVKHINKKLDNASQLKQGSQSKAVKALQKEFKRLQYYHGNIDGIFGPQTESATKAFQRESNIAVDGIVGPNTKRALENNPVSAEASAHKQSNEQTKKKTSTNSQVKQSSNNHQTETHQNEANNAKTHQSKASSTKTHPNKSSSTNTPNDQASKTTQHHSTSKTKAAHTSNSGSNNDATPKSNNSKGGKSITVEATAYTAHCSGCSGVTATGVNLKENPNKKVIAVDPDVIPLGSTVEVPGYGKAVAADTGGAINGNRIDIFKSDEGAASSYGRKNITVKVID